MLALKTGDPLSVEDYLKGELNSVVKHELVDGDARAMAGASTNHNRLSGTIFRKIANHFDVSTQCAQACEVFISDMKVRVKDNFFYPDVVASCDEPPEAQSGYTCSPILIAEVLSKSTRKIDQTTKRYAYTHIATMQEYVLIEQDFVDIEIIRRSNGWQSQHYYLGDDIRFESLHLTLSVEEIYARVDNEDMQLFLST